MKLLELDNGNIINLEQSEEVGIGEYPFVRFTSGKVIAITLTDFHRILELTMFYKGASDE